MWFPILRPKSATSSDTSSEQVWRDRHRGCRRLAEDGDRAADQRQGGEAAEEVAPVRHDALRTAAPRSARRSPAGRVGHAGAPRPAPAVGLATVERVGFVIGLAFVVAVRQGRLTVDPFEGRFIVGAVLEVLAMRVEGVHQGYRVVDRFGKRAAHVNGAGEVERGLLAGLGEQR